MPCKEEKIQLERAKKDWGGSFVYKEMFCQQYRKLRWLLFQNKNQAALETMGLNLAARAKNPLKSRDFSGLFNFLDHTSPL